jgi:hypothetical protein
MRGETWFNRKTGFHFNEGGGPVNFGMRWRSPPGFYIFFFGRRLYWFKKSAS